MQQRKKGWTSFAVNFGDNQTGKSSSDSKERDELEVVMGIEVFVCENDQDIRNGQKRQGYLFNMRPIIEYRDSIELDRRVRRSGVSLYFVDTHGTSFRTTLLYSPYFYVDVTDLVGDIKVPTVNDARFEVCQLLQQISKSKCQDPVLVEEVERIDLSQPGHIRPTSTGLYQKRPLLKVTCLHVEDLQAMRREVTSFIQRHKRLEEEANVLIKQSCGDLKNSVSSRDIKTRFETDPLLLVSRCYESDILYVARVCIDLGIRCGKWYTVELKAHSEPIIRACPDSVQGHPPPLRYLAWDIEVTKDPLKFPDAKKDRISLISYMCEGQGFLIVNRELLSEDIQPLEYTPRPEFPGLFTIFNVPNEREVIETFFSHICNLNPHILVTYNGDNFDFEFVRVRAKIHGLSMLDRIGFAYSTNDGLPSTSLGLPTKVRTALGDKQEYQGRIQVHIDCLRWVERDSYLPCGSRGLKAVTRAKLHYEPRELDPELMVPYQTENPRLLAEYSVSDAVATYYLYLKYIHNFTFALCSIIPLPPDDVLRKGSGTLCEHLLMAEAFKAGIIFPNKHTEPLEKWHDDALLYSETYVGGNVAHLSSGIFRADLKEQFQLDPMAYETLIRDVEKVFGRSGVVNINIAWNVDQWFLREEGQNIQRESVLNFEEIKNEIIRRLNIYRDNPIIKEEPLIYHFDVGAMYPNVILSNRLQPTSIVNEQICSQCDLYHEKTLCQKKMKWKWKIEKFPLSRNQIEYVKDQLSNEEFEPDFLMKSKKVKEIESSETESENDDHENIEISNVPKSKYDPLRKRLWSELSEKQQNEKLLERLKIISRKQSKKFKISKEEMRTDVVCMRENPFYVQTVHHRIVVIQAKPLRDFRDRRYIFKVRKKEAEERLAEAGDEQSKTLCRGEVVLFDSLQLAHKCILNSFYGYVMRKGARWYSMQMAAIVTYTGAEIIRKANQLANAIGKPLELDTDGIWTLLPKNFPTDFKFQYRANEGEIKTKTFNYPCTLFNLGVHETWTNKQYLSWNAEKMQFDRRDENSIFFEVDGPYKAMILPASEKEGQSLKKRYAVFNDSNEITELKGFEIKRRGELQVIKIFQEEVFPEFLKGTTLQEAYEAVSKIANRWLDFIETQGRNADTLAEVFELISESKFMSKPVNEQLHYKSMGITTAKRLTELLGDPTYVEDKGIKCEYILCIKENTEKTLRAIPIQLFDAAPDIQRLYLQKWLGVSSKSSIDPRSLLDWDYYKQRLSTSILKIIVIPAILQGLQNPVPRIVPPDWVRHTTESSKQIKLTSFFKAAQIQDKLLTDIEDIKLKQQQKKDSPRLLQQLSPTKENVAPLLDEKASDGGGPVDFIKEWIQSRRKNWKEMRQILLTNRQKESELFETLKIIKKTSIYNSTEKLNEEFNRLPSVLFHCNKRGTVREFNVWKIVDIETDVTVVDIIYLHVLIEYNGKLTLHRVPVKHKRKILINSKSRFHLDIANTKLVEVPKSKRKMLPRGLRSHYLYELTMSETSFRGDARTLKPGADIISIHGFATPLEFDLLRCYGNLLRLSFDSIKIEIDPIIGEVLIGPDSFECVGCHHDMTLKQLQLPSLQWLYITILHQGPIEQPERIVSCVFSPPSLNYSRKGSCLIFVGGGTSAFQSASKQFKPQSLFRKIVEETLDSNDAQMPSYLDHEKFNEVIETWTFAPIEAFKDLTTCLQRLSMIIHSYPGKAASEGLLPVGLYLFTTLPPIMIGKWADDEYRLSKESLPVCIFHSNRDLDPTAAPRCTKFNFIGDAFQFATKGLINNSIIVEWSNAISVMTQIPLLYILRWKGQQMELHRLILDLTFARTLEANQIVSWETTGPTPDLGHPKIVAQSPADFDIPESGSDIVIVNPTIVWTHTFDVHLGDQIISETITNLSILATLYDDPLKNYFDIPQKHGMIPKLKEEEDLNNNQELLQDDEVISFSHSSRIPGKILVVMSYALMVLQTAFLHLQQLTDHLSSVSSCPNYVSRAIGFIKESISVAHSWLASSESLLFDPALEVCISQWAHRYLNTLNKEILKISENHVIPLFISFGKIILTTPAVHEDISKKCLELLFEKLNENPLFSHLQLGTYNRYQCFLQYDSLHWLGITTSNSVNGHLGVFDYLPQPVSYFMKKEILKLIERPFKKAKKLTEIEHQLTRLKKAAADHLEIDGELIKRWTDTISKFHQLRTGPKDLELKFMHRLQRNVVLMRKCVADWVESDECTKWVSLTRSRMQKEIKMIEKRMKRMICQEGIPMMRRKLHYLKNQLNADHQTLVDQKAWEIPEKPGGLKIVTTPTSMNKTNHKIYLDRHGRKSQLHPSINQNELQIELARLLWRLLTLHEAFTSLDGVDKEELHRRFCDAIGMSVFSDDLKYVSLWNPLPLNGLYCEQCTSTFTLDIIGSLEETLEGPIWRCPYCVEHLSIDLIETRLLELVTSVVEAAQSQDLICRRCKELKKNLSITYCACGGEYFPRIPVIEFQLVLATVESVVYKHAEELPTLAESIEQLRSVGIQ